MKRVVVFYILALAILQGCVKTTEIKPVSCQEVRFTKSCAAVVTYITGNFSAIDVYVNGVFSFREMMAFDSLTTDCWGENIFFRPNVNNINTINLTKLSGSYCMAELNLTTPGATPIIGSINGTLDAFTEIKAGAYSFIPVRP